ncbi:MAG: beta-N-acetylglucosaminidase domain-containing protein [Pseudoflavonifractor sp.]|nr:beta-N-acetylglucosaminidase domain-containing protein [Alloprevotella sp.]MCM1116750.1 beta-N-acetylglucosaminidase domain-containing protein [Pseudoflavonifractor sp.]
MNPIIRPVIISFAALALTMSAPNASARRVDVSPVPQSVTWGQGVMSAPSGFKLTGSGEADADALSALLRAYPTVGSVKLTIGEMGDKAVKKYSSLIPDHAEGYYLKVTPKEIVVAGRDGKGTFYGVQTLLQMLAKAGNEGLTEVTVVDWPASSNRGVVEGFYGNPWSHIDRLSQFDFYGANKLDTYIYGPKDDPYHHSRWREPYPEEKAAQLRELAAAAAKNKVWFVWAMHPGNAIESAADRQAALDKLGQMYDMGFRSFAIFFDDISNYNASLQADYLNFLTDNFVKQHDDVTPIIVCPSEYNRGWAGKGEYLSTLGKEAYPEIRVMWTGNSVVDMINVPDIEWVEQYIGRQPFIWLNWPVNDYCIDHLLMGPFYGNDRESAAMTSGFVLNPMEYAEASKVSLYSGADYLWNPDAYNPQESWENAIRTLMPGHEDAFRTFCSYNVDLGQNTHRLRREEETPELKTLIDKTANGMTPELAAAFRAEFGRVIAAADELMAVAKEGNPLASEVKPWIEATKLVGMRGNKVMDMQEALAANDSVSFVDAYLEYAALADRASRLESRNFEGSIKSAHPVAATLYGEPFFKGQVASMVDSYKDTHSYKTDVFPKPVIENGAYRIVDPQGRFLGNPDAGSMGGNPIWQAAEDDVNPDRQTWRITLVPEKERYQIINAKDRRYINEIGNFSRNEQTNPFDADWHTFVIERNPDGSATFAIRNGGNGGNGYWMIDGDRIKTRRLTAGESPYIFRLIP